MPSEHAIPKVENIRLPKENEVRTEVIDVL